MNITDVQTLIPDNIKEVNVKEAIFPINNFEQTPSVSY